MSNETTFKQLVDSIQGIHRELIAQAGKTVNLSLTLRHWLIGFYIAEYQLSGGDRAAYGEKLLDNLAAELTGISNCKRRQLYDYLGFYRTYPTIVGTLSAQFQILLPPDINIDSEKVPTASAQLHDLSEKLPARLSYSHLKLLTDIENPAQRFLRNRMPAPQPVGAGIETPGRQPVLRTLRSVARQTQTGGTDATGRGTASSIQHSRSLRVRISGPEIRRCHERVAAGRTAARQTAGISARTNCLSPNTCWNCRTKPRCSNSLTGNCGRS